MYESYEELMERKLAMTQDKRDRRQGSLIFDAMGPNAAETAAFYADLTMLENRTFVLPGALLLSGSYGRKR